MSCDGGQCRSGLPDLENQSHSGWQGPLEITSPSPQPQARLTTLMRSNKISKSQIWVWHTGRSEACLSSGHHPLFLMHGLATRTHSPDTTALRASLRFHQTSAEHTPLSLLALPLLSYLTKWPKLFLPVTLPVLLPQAGCPTWRQRPPWRQQPPHTAELSL